MTVNEAIVTFLKQLATAAADRVYPKEMPQGGPMPAIVIHQISGVPDYTHEGSSGYAEATFQFDILAAKLNDCLAVRESVRLALRNFRGTMGGAGGPEVDGVFLDDERDDFNDELRLYVRQMDYLFEFGESTS